MKRILKYFATALVLLSPSLLQGQTYEVISKSLKTCRTPSQSRREVISPKQTDKLFPEKINVQEYNASLGRVEWSGTCTLVEISSYSMEIDNSNTQRNMILYIPKSIEKIGVDPFKNFSDHYSKIYIDDLEAWCKIEMADKSSNPCSITGNLYLNENLLKDLEVPESITKLKDYAFSYCSSLENVKLHNNITSLGDFIFSDCTNLANIEFSENPDFTYGSSIFAGCTSLTEIRIPANMKQIPSGTFSNCRNLEIVNLNDITSIGEKAFYYCKNLTNIELPESLVEIGPNSFYGSGLTSVIIPAQVERIEKNAFDNCSNLSEVKIGDGVKEIKSEAFYNCPSLTTISIGKSVNTIEDNVFSNGNLRVVTSLNPTPPTITNTTFNSETTEKGVLLVPEASISLYKLSPYWMDFQRIEAIPNSGGNGGSDDQNGETIFNVKIDKYIYMTVDEEQTFTDYLPLNVTASSWESSDEDIVEVTKRGKAEAYEYGNVIVRALDSNGDTLITLGVFVCPTVSVQYGDGKSYEHHVIYNSTPSLYIAAPEGYEISRVYHDGVDVTEALNSNEGYLTTSSPIKDNSTISVEIYSTKDPADLNGDGVVNVVDMNILIERMMNY